MPDDDDQSLLVDYMTATKIIGADALNAAIAAGKITPIRVNDKPGAAHLFPRSVLERMAGRVR